MSRIRATMALACGLALAASTGCGIFKSSTSQASFESSSKSSSSPFRSSSKSSGDEAQEALERDVGDYSASYATTRGDTDAFLRDIGTIARRHGVVDWEADAGVHRAMGRGFRRAGLDPDGTRALADALTADDPMRRAWLLAGHRSGAAE